MTLVNKELNILYILKQATSIITFFKLHLFCHYRGKNIDEYNTNYIFVLDIFTNKK